MCIGLDCGMFFIQKSMAMLASTIECATKRREVPQTLDYVEMLLNNILDGETRVHGGWVGCMLCGEKW